MLCNEMSTTKGFWIGKTRRANEEKHVLQGASAKLDVGSDKIWSTLDFGISEKFDHPPPGGQSPLEVYIVLSLNV